MQDQISNALIWVTIFEERVHIDTDFSKKWLSLWFCEILHKTVNMSVCVKFSQNTEFCFFPVRALCFQGSRKHQKCTKKTWLLQNVLFGFWQVPKSNLFCRFMLKCLRMTNPENPQIQRFGKKLWFRILRNLKRTWPGPLRGWARTHGEPEKHKVRVFFRNHQFGDFLNWARRVGGPQMCRTSHKCGAYKLPKIHVCNCCRKLLPKWNPN